MSKEIQLHIHVADRNFGLPSFYGVRLDLDCSGAIEAGHQSIGTGAWEAIATGDVGTPGLIALKNDDPTNYVELARDNAGAEKIGKLRPGEPFIIMPDASLTVYAKANTGACNLVKIVTPAVTPNGYTLDNAGDFIDGTRIVGSIAVTMPGLSVGFSWSKDLAQETDATLWESVTGTLITGIGWAAVNRTLAARYLFLFNFSDSFAVEIAQDNAGSKKIADLPVSGGIAFLSLSGSTTIYGNGPDGRIVASEVNTPR